jgi:hypothetical protein
MEGGRGVSHRQIFGPARPGKRPPCMLGIRVWFCSVGLWRWTEPSGTLAADAGDRRDVQNASDEERDLVGDVRAAGSGDGWVLQLADGRRLGFAEYGDPAAVVFPRPSRVTS